MLNRRVRHADGHDMADEAYHEAGAARRSEWRMVAAGAVTASVGATAYYLSSGPLQGRIWELTVAALLALMALGIWRFRAGGRLPWVLIWTGLTAAFVGGILVAHPWLASFSVESPSPVDALRLLNYPLGAAGVLMLLFRRDRTVGVRAALEAVIAVGAGGVVIAVLVIEPLLAASETTGLELTVAALYPLMDVLLLGVIAVLIVHVQGRPGALWLVALGLAGNLAADVAFAHQNLQGGYQPGGLIDVGWLLCFASFSVAPSWPTGAEQRVVGDDGRLTTRRLLFVSVSALLAPVIVIGQSLAGGRPDLVVTVASAGLVALVLVRVAAFNRDLQRSRNEVASLAEKLLVANRELETARDDQRRLLDRIHRAVEDERTRIAADIHDRPLQQLAGLGYRLEYLNVLLRRGDTDGAARVCDNAATELATQLGELRTLMTDIRPPALDQRGLVGALQDHGAAIHDDNPELEVVVRGDTDRVHGDAETALYRVAQQAPAERGRPRWRRPSRDCRRPPGGPRAPHGE